MLHGLLSQVRSIERARVLFGDVRRKLDKLPVPRGSQTLCPSALDDGQVLVWWCGGGVVMWWDV